MKISIFSDSHLGFGSGETREDPFECLEEAIENSRDSDLILIAGDIFDIRVPDTETLTRAMEILSKTTFMDTDIKLVNGINKEVNTLSQISLMGIPVIAIHGTHERRVKGFLNPVEALEKAGFLIYLHCNGVVFQKENEKVCIQGMSGVPDQYADSILSQWNPKPLPDCVNILMLHQSLSPFLYSPHTLESEKLPKGFDLYICGHIHESRKSKLGGSDLLIPGSFIHTQLREDPQSKGFWVLDTSNMGLEFRELERQRMLYHKEFQTENLKQEDIENYIREVINNPHKKKPLIRIKLKGKPKEITFREIENRFSQEAMVSFKRDFEECEFPIKNLEEHKLSVQELGRQILLKNLETLNLNPKIFEPIFELLLENNQERALEMLKNQRLKSLVARGYMMLNQKTPD